MSIEIKLLEGYSRAASGNGAMAILFQVGPPGAAVPEQNFNPRSPQAVQLPLLGFLHVRGDYSSITSNETPSLVPRGTADGLNRTCVSTGWPPEVMNRKVMFVSVASIRIAPKPPV